MLRCDRENEVVGGSDVCEDEGQVFDVSMGGGGLVGHLEWAVCGLLAVVGCGHEAEDYQPVRRRVRLQEDHLLSGLLLAPDLCKLPRLFLCYLCIGWCTAWGGAWWCWVASGVVGGVPAQPWGLRERQQGWDVRIGWRFARRAW